MTDSYLLNYKIKESGIKLGTLADKLGLSRAGLYNKINGISEFYGGEILTLSEVLGLSTEDRENIFFNKKVDKKSTKLQK